MRGYVASERRNGALTPGESAVVGSSIARSVVGRPSDIAVRSIDIEALSRGFGAAFSRERGRYTPVASFMHGLSTEILLSRDSRNDAVETMIGSAASGLMSGITEAGAVSANDDAALAELAQAVGDGVIGGVGEAGGDDATMTRLVNAGLVGAAIGHLTASGNLEGAGINDERFVAIVNDLSNVGQIEPGAGPAPSILERVRRRLGELRARFRRPVRNYRWSWLREPSSYGTVSPN